MTQNILYVYYEITRRTDRGISKPVQVFVVLGTENAETGLLREELVKAAG